MRKVEFTEKLKEKLQGLPKDAIDERISFFCEIIDDRIEEGMTEDEAVEKLGDIDEIVTQILSEIPLSKIVKEKLKPNRKVNAWEIVCLILGFPLWFPLLITAVCVCVALYVVLWSLVISFWTVDVSLIAGGVGGLVSGGVIAFLGNVPSGVFMVACSLVCFGLSILLFLLCKKINKFVLKFTKFILLQIKKLFIKK